MGADARAELLARIERGPMRMDTALGNLEPTQATLIAPDHTVDSRDDVDAPIPSLTETG